MSLTPVEEAQTRELVAQQAAILSLASSEPTIISKLAATKVNLSQLPAASSATDADLLLIRQGSTDKSIPGSVIKAYAKPGDATETVSGTIELATNAEVQAGTDTTRAVHPAGLASLTATETRSGLIELATVAEAQAMSDAVRALSPARLASAFGGSNQSLAVSGYQKLPSGLIIQWGTAAVAATGSYVSLPIAFPSAFTAVMTSMYVFAAPGVTTNNNVGVQSQADNLTRFVARCYQDGVGVAKTVTWIAIGY